VGKIAASPFSGTEVNLPEKEGERYLVRTSGILSDIVEGID
jgi:hypothetical protein